MNDHPQEEVGKNPPGISEALRSFTSEDGTPATISDAFSLLRGDPQKLEQYWRTTTEVTSLQVGELLATPDSAKYFYNRTLFAQI